MNSSELEKYWWSKITSARSFVNATIEALREHKVPALLVPNDLPWRETMRVVMQENIKKDIATLSIETIDVHNENGDNVEPGVFLLRHLNEINYRNGSRLTIQEHILKNGLLENKLLWIKGLSRHNYDAWLKFCNGFVLQQRSQGMIVIEVPFEKNLANYSNLIAVQYEALIRDYGVQLFVEHILDNMEYNDNWKRYISMLVSTVCKKDVEVAYHLIQEYKPHEGSIEDALKRLAEKERFAKRGEAQDHILNLTRQQNLTEIEKLVWTAQVQVLFPMIEIERHKWIERYRNEIQSVVDHEQIWIIKDKEKAESADDVEIGAIHLMYEKERLDNKCKPARKQRLEFLHECRNSLAHLRTCKPYQLAHLLDKKFEEIFN